MPPGPPLPLPPHHTQTCYVPPQTHRIDRKEFHGATRGQLLQRMRDALPVDKQGVVLVQVRPDMPPCHHLCLPNSSIKPLNQRCRWHPAQAAAATCLSACVAACGEGGGSSPVRPLCAPCVGGSASALHGATALPLWPACAAHARTYPLAPWASLIALPTSSLVRSQAGETLPVYNTDGEMLFRQEAFFHYLFGVNEGESLCCPLLHRGVHCLCWCGWMNKVRQ